MQPVLQQIIRMARVSNLSADFGASNTNKSLEIDNNDIGIGGAAITLAAKIKLQTEITSGRYTMAVLQTGATNYRGFYLAYDYNAGTRRVKIHANREGIQEFAVHLNGALGTSAWHSLVLRYDGATLEGHVDGASIGTIAFSGVGNSLYDKKSFTLGCLRDGFSLTARTQYSPILLDEVSVWLIDKGSSWANAYHTDTAGLVGNEANLRAYYKFNADLVSDITANNYDLTNLNSVAQSYDAPF